MEGVATQVDQIQLGRFVAAGTPVFSVIDVDSPGSTPIRRKPISPMSRSASPSRSTSTRSRTIVFKGTVGSLSPGTGAQFAILPPQNATGNFVKVVQRVPVRIYFDDNDRLCRG